MRFWIDLSIYIHNLHICTFLPKRHYHKVHIFFVPSFISLLSFLGEWVISMTVFLCDFSIFIMDYQFGTLVLADCPSSINSFLFCVEMA